MSEKIIVALLAEGVDRNIICQQRRDRHPVALLAEGVDRNTVRGCRVALRFGRPPRGGRG